MEKEEEEGNKNEWFVYQGANNDKNKVKVLHMNLDERLMDNTYQKEMDLSKLNVSWGTQIAKLEDAFKREDPEFVNINGVPMNNTAIADVGDLARKHGYGHAQGDLNKTDCLSFILYKKNRFTRVFTDTRQASVNGSTVKAALFTFTHYGDDNTPNTLKKLLFVNVYVPHDALLEHKITFNMFINNWLHEKRMFLDYVIVCGDFKSSFNAPEMEILTVMVPLGITTSPVFSDTYKKYRVQAKTPLRTCIGIENSDETGVKLSRGWTEHILCTALRESNVSVLRVLKNECSMQVPFTVPHDDLKTYCPCHMILGAVLELV